MKEIAQLPEGEVEVSGHLLYVSKCLQPEMFYGSNIVLPTLEKPTHGIVAEVKAVGPDVGKDRTESTEWCKRHNIQRRSELSGVEVGSLVILPAQDPLVTLSPFDKNEFFVDVGIAKGLVYDGN